MGFDNIEKIKAAQNMQNSLSEETLPISEIPDGALSYEENINLTQGISGQVLSPGFTENDAEQLNAGLSGIQPEPESYIGIQHESCEDNSATVNIDSFNDGQDVNKESVFPTTEKSESLETNTDDKTKQIVNISTQEQNKKKVYSEKGLRIDTFGENEKEDGVFYYLKNFEKISIKELRNFINNIQEMSVLEIIRKRIAISNFSNLDREILFNMCTHRQGIIQQYAQNSKTEQNDLDSHETDVKLKKENIIINNKSLLSFELFSVIKNNAQRKLANFILNNTDLYMCRKECLNAYKIFFSQFKNAEDIKKCEKFLRLILSTQEFKNADGSVSEDIIESLSTVNTDNIDYKLIILEEYQKKDKKLNPFIFIRLISECKSKSDCDAIKTLVNSKENNIEKINQIKDLDSVNELINVIRLYDKELLKELSFEDIASYKNTRLIASVLSQVKDNEELVAVIKQMLRNKEFYQSVPDVVQNESEKNDVCLLLCELIDKQILNSEDNKQDKKCIVNIIKIVTANEELYKNYDLIKTIVDCSKEQKTDKLNVISHVLEEYSKNSNEKPDFENIATVIANISDKVMYLNLLEKLAKNDIDLKKTENAETQILCKIIEEDVKIYKNFTTGRAYSTENLEHLSEYINNRDKREVLSDLCKNREFTANNIITILENTPTYAVNLTKKILKTKNLTAQQKTDVISIINTNRGITSTVENLLETNNFNMSCLPKLLDSERIAELKGQENQQETFSENIE